MKVGLDNLCPAVECMLDEICPEEIGDGEGTDNMTAILVRFKWKVNIEAVTLSDVPFLLYFFINANSYYKI